MLRAVLPALLAAATVVATATAAPDGTPREARAQLGSVAARLSFEQRGPRSRNFRLRITREGRVAFDRRVRLGCGMCFNAMGARPLRLARLDGDSEPEVLIDVYSGGAHCCTSTVIYRYDGGRYRTSHAYWGNYGYRLVDLDRSGGAELSSFDDRFAGAFAAYAVSAAPIRIRRYDRGRLLDVTREFPNLIRTDEREHWRLYQRVRRMPDPELRGVLAAWVADKALLGEAAEAFALLERLARRGDLGRPVPPREGLPAGRAYIAKLRGSLRAWGYLS